MPENVNIDEGNEEDTFVDYIYNALDKDGLGLDFKEFISGLTALSTGSLKQKLLLSFSVYDVDGSGKVRKYEMKSVLSSLYGDSESVNQLVEEIYAKYDRDKSDSLSYMEYIQMILSHPHLADFSVDVNPSAVSDSSSVSADSELSGKSLSSIPAHDSHKKFSLRNLAILRKEFQEAAKISGEPSSLENAEFKAVLDAHAIDWRSEVIFDRIFQTFDTAGDNCISYDEFICGLSALTADTPREKLEFVFNIFDVDGTGSINQEEMFLVLKAWFSGEYDDTAAQEFVAQVFANSDKDKSGSLSLREFISAALTFKPIMDVLNSK